MSPIIFKLHKDRGCFSFSDSLQDDSRKVPPDPGSGNADLERGIPEKVGRKSHGDRVSGHRRDQADEDDAAEDGCQRRHQQENVLLFRSASEHFPLGLFDCK